MCIGVYQDFYVRSIVYLFVLDIALHSTITPFILALCTILRQTSLDLVHHAPAVALVDTIQQNYTFLSDLPVIVATQPESPSFSLSLSPLLLARSILVLNTRIELTSAK